MLISDLILKWDELIVPTHKPSTQASEKVHLARLLRDFGHVDIESLRLEDIQRWAVKLSGSPLYVRNTVATLRQLWDMAQAWGYVDEDRKSPFEKLKMKQTWREERPFLTTDQQEKLITMAAEPFKTVLWILAETGMRIGEVLALRKEDIDWDEQVIRVRRSTWRGNIDTPKTQSGLRRIPISDFLARHLNPMPDGYFFGHGKIDSSNLLKKLQPLLAALGLPQMGFHAFRHGNATWMANNGSNEQVRKDRLGHSDFRTTKGYTHAEKDYHRNLANKIGEAVRPK